MTARPHFPGPLARRLLAFPRFAMVAGFQLVLATSASFGAVDFVRDIQPIFEKRCYECHDAKKVKGGLRLDQKRDFFRGGDSGKSPVRTDAPAESVLIKRLVTTDEDEKMPPKGAPLTAAEIAKIEAWIREGAVWPDSAAPAAHWAYVKPVRPPTPSLRQPGWVRSGLDAHVLARLEREGLRPSPEASRATWIRRVSLDLTGLPPTPEEVVEFENDTDARAYEKVVDRLLMSPHYGERWARPWLDLARYADTQGYEKDNRRTIWPYRDWVIRALNRNLPFDQFTIEQIAGDLLPNATPEQRVATGFHRNTMTNTEGGTDNEEFRHEALIDRVNTTFAVWMGSTFNCAQCHNHKYDPFTMRDYYGVYAILNQTSDADRDDDAPWIELPTDQQSKKRAELRQTLSRLETTLQATTPEFTGALQKWEAEQRRRLTAWTVLTPASVKSEAGGTFRVNADGAILATGTPANQDAYVTVVETPFQRLSGLRVEFVPHESLPARSSGRAQDGSFVLSGVSISVLSGATGKPSAAAVIARADADGTRAEFAVTNLLAGTGAGWSIEPNKESASLHLTLEPPLDIPVGARVEVRLIQRSTKPQALIGHYRLWGSAVPNPPTVPALPAVVDRAVRIPSDARSEDDSKTVSSHFRAFWPGLSSTRAELARVKSELDQLNRSVATSLVYAAVETPRETRFLVRGSFLTKGDVVTASTPEVLHPVESGPKGPDRLMFARWLVSTNNPLTARVHVNRLWELMFGRGIVETPEEFGKQGEPPTNPELLDWLAVELMANGWDQKQWLKTVVLSATYRQGSAVTPEALEKDPSNRFLSRGPRVRLDGETVRDQALAISGLLSTKVGGPSVMPYQPEGLWQVVYSGDQWITSPGEDRYRRGLYTFWRRSSPHPMLVNFDAPSREFCVLKRNRSNTPLQALNLLNDPAFIEFAQGFARRIVREGGDTVEQRVQFAIRTAMARAPRPAELQRLVRLFEDERKRFESDPAAAEKMAKSRLGVLSPGYSVSEMAAWTVVANVLLNLDEVVTKG